MDWHRAGVDHMAQCLLSAKGSVSDCMNYGELWKVLLIIAT